jgi:hypothetical protein
MPDIITLALLPASTYLGLTGLHCKNYENHTARPPGPRKGHCTYHWAMRGGIITYFCTTYRGKTLAQNNHVSAIIIFRTYQSYTRRMIRIIPLDHQGSNKVFCPLSCLI